VSFNNTKNCCQQGNGHADDAVPVTAARCLLIGETAEGQNKKYGRNDVRHCNDALTHLPDLTYGTFQAYDA